MTKYGRSPWLDRFPKSRVPSYPRYRGSMEIEAVIIGGGLTGCATAYAFAAAGVLGRVAVRRRGGIDRVRVRRLGLVRGRGENGRLALDGDGDRLGLRRACRIAPCG